MTTAILIIADTQLLGNCVQESLMLAAGYKSEVICDKEDWDEKLKRTLKGNKKIRVLLTGLKDDLLVDWIWSTIRSEENLQNPIIALGYESDNTFCTTHPVFSKGTSKYHGYLAAPWTVERLTSIIQEIKPLQGDDDWHREEIFKRFGESNMYKRIFVRMHGIKGADQENELPLALEVDSLCRRLDDEDLQNLTTSLVDALQNGMLNKTKQIRHSIEQFIRNK